MPANSAGTGARAHPWADVLHEVGDLEVRFAPGMPEHIQRLMGTLGVRVVFDSSLPADYANPDTGRHHGHGGGGRRRA